MTRAGRIVDYAPPGFAQLAPAGVEHELKRSYYDLAISGHLPAFAALAAMAPYSQILFGSDHPYRPLRESAARPGSFGLGAAELRAIGRDNALALLPRLGAAAS